jgi:hypothetical protein
MPKFKSLTVAELSPEHKRELAAQCDALAKRYGRDAVAIAASFHTLTCCLRAMVQDETMSAAEREKNGEAAIKSLSDLMNILCAATGVRPERIIACANGFAEFDNLVGGDMHPDNGGDAAKAAALEALAHAARGHA